MSKHHTDVVHCGKLPGVAVGKLCERCEERCIICDSYFGPHTEVHICDECNYGSLQGKCIICGAGNTRATAFYCKECVLLQRDRDGCPRIQIASSTRSDVFFERKKNTKKLAQGT